MSLFCRLYSLLLLPAKTFFFISFATHSTQSSTLLVSFSGYGRGMMTSGHQPVLRYLQVLAKLVSTVVE